MNPLLTAFWVLLNRFLKSLIFKKNLKNFFVRINYENLSQISHFQTLKTTDFWNASKVILLFRRFQVGTSKGQNLKALLFLGY